MRSFPGQMVVDSLSFSFGSGEIFSSFSVSLGEGEHILILSPPGTGKSTLARILTGSVPAYFPGKLAGSASVNGVDILSLPAPDRLERVCRISQNTDEMLLFSSVEEEILFPLENMNLDRSEIERRVQSSLDKFSMSHIRKASSAQLSGGEKRRLMLALLFAVDPDVYIFDESYDELSPSWREKLSSEIKALDKAAIVLGSHSLDEYEGVFDRVLTIKDGRCVPYEPEPMPQLSYSGRIGSLCLSADDIVISRSHKSISEEMFTLRVDGFSLMEGSCVTLLGENGSGKSSFARVLSGLLREDKGHIRINGEDVSFKERRHKCAYLMQNPYQELFLPTVYDELKSTGKSDDEINAVLSVFSLSGDSYVSELSYGKAKLVQVALFYLLSRPFAIFDELDSALSYEDSVKAVSSYLDKGTGLLVITHDRKFASLLPGRKLIADGDIHEY